MTMTIRSGTVGVVSITMPELRDRRAGRKVLSHRDRLSIERRVAIEAGQEVADRIRGSWLRLA